jgi:hypothetical protein
LDESKQRGYDSQYSQGEYHPDVAGSIAQMLPAMAATKAIPVAQTILGKIGQNAAIGAVSGAATPVTSDDFSGSKGKQVAMGAGVGAAISPAVSLASALGRGGRNVWDVVGGTKGGIERIKRAYYERLVGDKNVPSVISSLKSADEVLPGGKPTAAEAVANNPTGTSIQAQQAATAGTPGGISSQFNARLNAQNIARESAKMERDAVTKPMREDALAKATNINRLVLQGDLTKVSAAPEIQAVDAASKLLSKVQEQAVNAAKNQGARGLYGVRKYIDDLIEGRVDSEDNVAKSLTPRLVEMKEAIDKAIENGGAGAEWPAYLSEFAKRSKSIESSLERSEGMYKPLQRTAIQGGDNIAEHTATKLPNILSREAMIANWVARIARGRVEPKIDASMAQDFLDPKLMAAVMEISTPQSRKLLSDALAKHYRVAAPSVAVQEQR